jgi:hypothetical protein
VSSNQDSKETQAKDSLAATSFPKGVFLINLEIARKITILHFDSDPKKATRPTCEERKRRFDQRASKRLFSV